MDRRKFLATTGAAIAGVGLAGCGDATNGGNGGNGNGTNGGTGNETNGGEDDAADEFDWEEVEAEIGETPDAVEISDSRLVETEEGAAVIGTLRNTGENSLSVVEVEVTLNDDDTVLGEWVDTTEEDIDDLGAGETWRFVATFEGENVYDATGYTINVDADVEVSEGDGAGDGTGTETGNGTSTETGNGTSTETGNGTSTETGNVTS